MTGNTIISNTAGYKYYVYLSGGGLEVKSSAGSLTNNVIAGNHANGNILFGNGGGLAVYSSTLSLQGGQILNNLTAINCEGYGGGLYASNSSLTLNAARLNNNCAANTPFYGLGGGLAFFNSPYPLTNAVVAKNRAFGNDTSVGGLYADVNSPGWIVNNTFANNRGQGIRIAAPITVTNNIIMGHTTGISLTASVAVSAIFNDFYNNTTHQRGFSLNSSNIVINPQLDASYHLSAGSPLSTPARASTRLSPIWTASRARWREQRPVPLRHRRGRVHRPGAGEPQPGPAAGRLHPDRSGQSADNPASNGSNDWIGYAVLGGDINGDQRADLIVGAPNLSGSFSGGANDDGRVFALYNTGLRRSGVTDLYTTTANLEVRSWLHQQHIGQSFAASDLNGDGSPDLIIGASAQPTLASPARSSFLPAAPG